MSAFRLVIRELWRRRTNFLLAVLAITVASGCVVAALSLVDRYRQRSQTLAEAEHASLQKRMAALEDDYRKISLKLGFNLMILPKDQNLADFYAEDFASKLMPESYAQKLADARLATINHILPVLQQRITWPEQKRNIQLIGTKGEVAYMSKGRMAALQAPVAPGNMVVGYELHRSLNLKVGDVLALQGKKFKVAGLQSQRGNQDDITLWVNLGEAQELLNKKGQINAVMALECNCAADLLATIRNDVARVLPDTQVIEFASQAVTRAEARDRAAQEATEAVQRQQAGRAAADRQRERFLVLCIPVVIAACAVWAGLLALGNVRGRTAEIGILRAIGVPSTRVLSIFLARAALIGLAGGAIGFLAGWLGSWLGENRLSGSDPLGLRFSLPLCLAVILATPLFSTLVSLLPAVWAASLDPAETLKET